jgi:hypothetical protein
VVSALTGADLHIEIDAENLTVGENTITPEIEDGEDYYIEGNCEIVVTVTNMP